jgi:hypothetical protein
MILTLQLCGIAGQSLEVEESLKHVHEKRVEFEKAREAVQVEAREAVQVGCSVLGHGFRSLHSTLLLFSPSLPFMSIVPDSCLF